MNSKRLCNGFLIVLINMSLYNELNSSPGGERTSYKDNGSDNTRESNLNPTVLPVSSLTSAKTDSSNNVIDSNTSPTNSKINGTNKEGVITNKSNSEEHETSGDIESNRDDSSQDEGDEVHDEESEEQELDENNETQSDDIFEEESENDSTIVDHQKNQYRKLKLRREIDDNNENKDNKDLLKLNEQEIDDIKQFSENKISSIENEIKAASLKCQKACFECIRHSLKDIIEDAKVTLENLQADKGDSESKIDNEKSKMASDLKYSFNTAQKDYDKWIDSCKNNFPNGYCLYDSLRNSESMKNSVIIGGNAYWTEKCISHYMLEIIPPLYIEQVQKDFHELIKDIQKLHTQTPDLGKKSCLQCVSVALESKYNDVGNIINSLKKEYISKQEKQNYMARAKDLLKTLYFSENQIDTQWKYSCLHFESNVEIFENIDEQERPLLINKDDDANLLKCMHKYINMEHWLLLLQPEEDEDLELAFE